MRADLTVGFDLADRGIVQGTFSDGCGVIGSALSIPNSAWPGWSNGKSPCRIDGYVERFNWPEGVSPAYVVRTLDDGFLYEFRPADLLPYLPHAKHIAALQSRYVDETGIASLKIRHNNVLGYFIDVTTAQAEKMPTGEDSRFIHRQTLASAMRFTTVELGELEGKLAQAGERALAMELELFDDLVRETVARAEVISFAADALARLDVSAALAVLATDRRYVRPRVDDGTAFSICGGRHPVVEAALAAARDAGFIANDCDLAETHRLWLVTGPNMAGKSTFLRQNALLAIIVNEPEVSRAPPNTLSLRRLRWWVASCLPVSVPTIGVFSVLRRRPSSGIDSSTG